MDILFPSRESTEGDEAATQRVYSFWAAMDELIPDDRVLVVKIPPCFPIFSRNSYFLFK